MKIEVTQEHINNGKKSGCRSCPLALALRVHFPTAAVGVTDWWEDSVVTAQTQAVYSGERNELGVEVFKRLPDEAFKFRWQFDSGLPVYPFTFEVEV